MTTLQNPSRTIFQRIDSIDLLRGTVIVIMALDHIRDYFHADAFMFDPTDVTKTSAALFFTRWITHFCAPVFVFLAGTSAFQIGIKKGIPEVSSFLLKRGLWLIFLEVTVINFAWFFNIHFSFIALTVIWALAIGMIALAGLVWLPKRLLLVISVAVIFIHNSFDGFHVEGTGPGAFLWSIIHDQKAFSWGENRFVFVGYGLMPWVAVMALGYCFGELYAPSFDAVRRKKILLQLGFSAVILFVVLRFSNLYGDPHPWSSQPSALFTVLSFLNNTKYPPSLLYLLMTLGPAMLFLAVTENVRTKIASSLVIIGRVPLFFYVLHIYVIHFIALFAAIATGFGASSMVFNTWVTNSAPLQGYGFGLGIVYLIWIIVIIGLYPLCKWFDAYKRGNKDKWWLSYC